MTDKKISEIVCAFHVYKGLTVMRLRVKINGYAAEDVVR